MSERIEIEVNYVILVHSSTSEKNLNVSGFFKFLNPHSSVKFESNIWPKDFLK